MSRAASKTVTDAFRRKTHAEFVLSVIEGAVLTGQIDPVGKSEQELQELAIRFLRGLIRRPAALRHVIDHRLELLQHARAFARSGKAEMAVLLYATWMEHWINSLIVIACMRKRVPSEQVTELLRETSFRGKTTWLISILDKPTIAPSHRNRMLQVLDLRNAFVHYKWRGLSEEALEQQEKAIAISLERLPATVKYLNQYERKHLYHGSKRKVRAAVRLGAG